MIVGKKAGWVGKEKPVEVTVEKVQRRTILETVTANGKIQPETEVKISPEVSGEIVALYVKEGDYVEKGTLLLKIKPDIYVSGRERAQAAVNSSKASLANASSRLVQAEASFDRESQAYDRSKILWDQKTISLADWQTAESSFKTAKAEVESARQNVKGAQYGVLSAEASLKEANENLIKTTIYAPMSGTVSTLKVETGEKVVGTQMMSGTEIMRIANLDRMEVRVDVNENDIVRVHMNDTAIIEVDAYLGQKFKGIVTQIANSASTEGLTTDQVTNFEVRVLILQDSYKSLITKNNPHPFRPGMSASLDIQTKKVENVLSVPVMAVVILKDSTENMDEFSGSSEVKNNEVVYLFDNGRAKTQKVKTGIQDKDFIEIKDGLKESDMVITGPYNVVSKKLKDGMLVTKTSNKNPAKK